MDILEKYNLKRSKDIVYKLREDGKDDLYIKENGKLKLIATKPHSFSILQLFLQKYRSHPELLPKDLKHESDTDSSKTILKAMKIMLTPMNTFEEFKKVINIADTQLAPLALQDAIGENKKEYQERIKNFRYGEKLVFINKKEDCGSGINMYDQLIRVLKERKETYWERAILLDKEKNIFALYYKEERSNDNFNKDNWSLDIKFYEEKYLYEYLLNEAIGAVQS